MFEDRKKNITNAFFILTDTVNIIFTLIINYISPSFLIFDPSDFDTKKQSVSFIMYSQLIIPFALKTLQWFETMIERVKSGYNGGCETEK